MSLWQIEAAKNMTDFITAFLKVERVDLTGSILTQNLLDVFSDVDMEIYLSDHSTLDLKYLLKMIGKNFCTIFGYQISCCNDKVTLRICFENGWRFDLTFRCPNTITLRHQENSFANKVVSVINEFWFIAVLVLVKLGRKDYLVAAHLALELCQLHIVVQMLLRDNEKDTTTHRYGDKEEVPILHTLTQSKESDTKDAVLGILYQSAEHMETISALFVNACRINKLREMQNQMALS
jgi:hypothetical protein